MKTPYYTLLERAAGSHTWTIEFGDYSRKVVEAEMRDRRESDRAAEPTERSTFRVIATDDDTQEAIDAAVTNLNQLAVNAVIQQRGTIR
jgi:hypothetical protein